MNDPFFSRATNNKEIKDDEIVKAFPGQKFDKKTKIQAIKLYEMDGQLKLAHIRRKEQKKELKNRIYKVKCADNELFLSEFESMECGLHSIPENSHHKVNIFRLGLEVRGPRSDDFSSPPMVKVNKIDFAFSADSSTVIQEQLTNKFSPESDFLQERIKAVKYLKDFLDLSLQEDVLNRNISNALSDVPSFYTSKAVNDIQDKIVEVLKDLYKMQIHEFAWDSVPCCRLSFDTDYQAYFGFADANHNEFLKATLLQETVPQFNEVIDYVKQLDQLKSFFIVIQHRNFSLKISVLEDHMHLPNAKEAIFINKKLFRSGESDAEMKKENPNKSVQEIAISLNACDRKGNVHPDCIMNRIKSHLLDHEALQGLRATECTFFDIEHCGFQHRRLYAVLGSIWTDQNGQEFFITTAYVLATADAWNILKKRKSNRKGNFKLLSEHEWDKSKIPTLMTPKSIQAGGTEIRSSLVNLRGKFSMVDSLLSSKPAVTSAASVPKKQASVEELERMAKESLETRKMSTPSLSIRESQMAVADYLAASAPSVCASLEVPHAKASKKDFGLAAAQEAASRVFAM